MTAPNGGDRLRLDYSQTVDLLRSLTDVRFKLLALVPTVAGTAVALLGRPRPAAELLGVGLLGLVATAGVLAYDLRNTQLYEYALRRAGAVEARLGMLSPFAERSPGGLFAERPEPARRPLGLPGATHDGALALVYGAALAGWSYLVAWGGLRALDVGGARKAGAAIGVGLGLLVVLELLRPASVPGKQEGPARVLLSMEPKEDKQERVRPWDGELVDDDEAVEASGKPVEADDDDDVEAHGSWGGAG
jgi:hypothetical protein